MINQYIRIFFFGCVIVLSISFIDKCTHQPIFDSAIETISNEKSKTKKNSSFLDEDLLQQKENPDYTVDFMLSAGCRLYKNVNNTDVLKQVIANETVDPDSIFKIDCADVGAEIYGLADLGLFTSLIDVNLSRTEITGINVEFSEQLIHIDISETEFAGELNLEKNARLKHMDAHGIDLDKLDIDDNKQLEYINVSDTELDALGTENDELPYHIKHLDISNTNIKQLDIAESTSFMALKHLDISGTPIQELDLLSKARLIEYLDISNTFVDEINLENNKKLKQIKVSGIEKHDERYDDGTMESTYWENGPTIIYPKGLPDVAYVTVGDKTEVYLFHD